MHIPFEKGHKVWAQAYVQNKDVKWIIYTFKVFDKPLLKLYFLQKNCSVNCIRKKLCTGVQQQLKERQGLSRVIRYNPGNMCDRDGQQLF